MVTQVGLAQFSPKVSTQDERTPRICHPRWQVTAFRLNNSLIFHCSVLCEAEYSHVQDYPMRAVVFTPTPHSSCLSIGHCKRQEDWKPIPLISRRSPHLGLFYIIYFVWSHISALVLFFFFFFPPWWRNSCELVPHLCICLHAVITWPSFLVSFSSW